MKSIMRKYFLGAMLSLSLVCMPALTLGAEDPWKFLEDFTPLPKSLTRIAENYVAVLFENREQQLLAAVTFKASCFAASCEINHRAGYALANVQGSNTRLYVEPNEEELIELMGAISVQYSRSF